MGDFTGFASNRYQQHDAIIREVVIDFNNNKAARVGCSAEQASKIPDIDESMVKSWMIQESGGSDVRSLAAWRVDPVQVNVPGDWSDNKTDLGLSKPIARNEGNLKDNLKAAVALLGRKGFGKSGNAPKPDATFDGWDRALQRYNGRSLQCDNGSSYSQNYSDRIINRKNNPKTNVEIEIGCKN